MGTSGTDRPANSVVAVPLRIIPDERGAVLHMLRSDSPLFTEFGEVYFSEVKGGSIKAWKRHRRMTQRLAVPVGRMLFAILDDRPGSEDPGKVSEYELGRPDAYQLLIIPPMVWYGFQALSSDSAIIANCPDLAHDPDEIERIEAFPGQGSYSWRVTS